MILGCDKNMKLLNRLGEFITKCYVAYSTFIHNIFRDELGDFVEYLLDIVIAVIIVKLVASVAFQTKSRG